MQLFYHTSLIAAVLIAIVQVGFGFFCLTNGYPQPVCLTSLSKFLGQYVGYSYVRNFYADPWHRDCLYPDKQKCCRQLLPYDDYSDNWRPEFGYGRVPSYLYRGWICMDMDPDVQCEKGESLLPSKRKRMEGPGVEVPGVDLPDPSCYDLAHGKSDHAANVNNASPNTLAKVSDGNLGENQIVDLTSDIAAPDGKNDQKNIFADDFSSKPNILNTS